MLQKVEPGLGLLPQLFRILYTPPVFLTTLQKEINVGVRNGGASRK
jgi:hypothetical protein